MSSRPPRARPASTCALGHLPDDLGVPPGWAEVVLLLDVIEHVDDDVATLGAARTGVGEGGLLVVTVPAYQWLWSGHDEVLGHRRRYTAGGAPRRRRARRLHGGTGELLQHVALSAAGGGPWLEAPSRRSRPRSAAPHGAAQLAARAGLRLRAPPGPARVAPVRRVASPDRPAMTETRSTSMREWAIVGWRLRGPGADRGGVARDRPPAAGVGPRQSPRARRPLRRGHGAGRRARHHRALVVLSAGRAVHRGPRVPARAVGRRGGPERDPGVPRARHGRGLPARPAPGRRHRGRRGRGRVRLRAVRGVLRAALPARSPAGRDGRHRAAS